MKPSLALILALPLAGCAITIPIGGQSYHLATSAPEAAFQALDAVDFSQTVTIARRPNQFWELDFPTENLIGRHPSPAGVEAYWGATAAAHWAIAGWLDREAAANGGRWWSARTLFYGLSIGWSAYNVSRNASIGLAPFGAGDCPPNRRAIPVIQRDR